jgi:hypothetical protein
MTAALRAFTAPETSPQAPAAREGDRK